MKSVDCCSELYRGKPLHRLTAVPLPFQGRLMHKPANAVKNKVYRLHRKTPEHQHYRYRQGQQPALASPRRTARNERIPPDGFDMAALEVTLCGGTPPPPNGGPPRTERSPLPCGHLPTPWGVTPFRGGLCTSLRGNVADFHEESSKSIDKTVKMDYNCKGSPTKNRFSASLP